MGYWPSRKDDNLFFLSCPDIFTPSRVRILKTAKASYAQKGLLTPNPKARLRDQVREVLRFHHYSLRTEKAYWQWIRRYLVFCRDHPHLTSASALQAPNIEPSVAKALQGGHSTLNPVCGFHSPSDG
jgi:hypothetical protein